MKHKIKYFLLALNLVLVLLTVIAYLSPVVPPSENRLPGILGLFFPILFFLNLFAILFWLSFGRWYAIISMICILAGFQHIRHFIQLGIHTKETIEQTITVATYNVFSFQKVGQSENTVKHAFSEIVSTLGNPDIICLQESIRIGLKNEPVSGYEHVFKVPGSGTVLLSKYPIITSGHISFDSILSLSGWIDVKVQSKVIRVFGLHLMSNRITEETEQLLEEGRIRDSRTWQMAGGLIQKYSAASSVRAAQAEQIRKLIDKSPYPVLLIGDFNDTPQSYAYATITGEDMQDSFVAKGAGIGTTYGGSIPGLRIDYVLSGPEFTILGHTVHRLPYSDHYAVLAECVVTN